MTETMGMTEITPIMETVQSVKAIKAVVTLETLATPVETMVLPANLLKEQMTVVKEKEENVLFRHLRGIPQNGNLKNLAAQVERLDVQHAGETSNHKKVVKIGDPIAKLMPEKISQPGLLKKLINKTTNASKLIATTVNKIIATTVLVEVNY